MGNMDRNKILKCNKESNLMDQGQEHINKKSTSFESAVLLVILLIVWIYDICKGLPAQDVMSIFWAYFAAMYIHQYRCAKTMVTLISAIFGSLAAVFSFAAYIVQTW